MTDFSSLIKWYEIEMSFDERWGDLDIDNVDFSDTYVVNNLRDIARNKSGELGERKVSKAVSTTEFLDEFRLNSRKFQASIISEIDRLTNFDDLNRIATGIKEEFRLIARQRGINYAKEQIRGVSIENFPPEATDFLRKYSPQTLGRYVQLETQKLKKLGIFK